MPKKGQAVQGRNEEGALKDRIPSGQVPNTWYTGKIFIMTSANLFRTRNKLECLLSNTWTL